MDVFRSAPEESRNGKNQNQQTVPPSISLPKDGGAIREIDKGLQKYQDAEESDVVWRSPSVAPKAFGTTISVCDWGIVAGIRQDTSLASRLEHEKGGEASNDYCEHFVLPTCFDIF
jgi:hypothetical protein